MQFFNHQLLLKYCGSIIQQSVDILLCVLFFTFTGFGSAADCSEFGKLLGRFPDRTQHDVAGTIYVINENTIWVRGFSYDGTAPGTVDSISLYLNQPIFVYM